MSSKEEILFERNIVNSVAKELGMHQKKISLHMTFLKAFINDIAKSDEHSLQFPHLGVMYRNLKGCARMNIIIEKAGLLEKGEEAAKFKKMLEKNTRDIESISLDTKQRVWKSYHTTRRRMQHPYFTRGRSKKLLEEFQNEKQDTES